MDIIFWFLFMYFIWRLPFILFRAVFEYFFPTFHQFCFRLRQTNKLRLQTTFIVVLNYARKFYCLGCYASNFKLFKMKQVQQHWLEVIFNFVKKKTQQRLKPNLQICTLLAKARKKWKKKWKIVWWFYSDFPHFHRFSLFCFIVPFIYGFIYILGKNVKKWPVGLKYAEHGFCLL